MFQGLCIRLGKGESARRRLAGSLVFGAFVALGGCALPPPKAPAPLSISGVLRDIDVKGRFLSLEDEKGGPRTVYWDDSTRFSSGGEEVSPRDADRLLGDRVAVLAVPMGGKMVANSCTEL